MQAAPSVFFLISMAIFTLPIWWAEQPAAPNQYWLSTLFVDTNECAQNSKASELVLSVNAFCFSTTPLTSQTLTWFWKSVELLKIQIDASEKCSQCLIVRAGWASVANAASSPGSNRKQVKAFRQTDVTSESGGNTSFVSSVPKSFTRRHNKDAHRFHSSL